MRKMKGEGKKRAREKRAISSQPLSVTYRCEMSYSPDTWIYTAPTACSCVCRFVCVVVLATLGVQGYILRDVRETHLLFEDKKAGANRQTMKDMAQTFG